MRHLFSLPILLLLFFVLPASAQVTGISYTLAPMGNRVYWDDDAGLGDGYLYGGQIGLGFGQYLELSGVYLFNNNDFLGAEIETDFSNFSGNNETVLEALAALEARPVDVQRYGAKIRLNVGSGNVIPFITGGTGVIRFDPQDLNETESIYLTGGVGVTFSLADRYTISVAGEGLGYRFNPSVFVSEEDLTDIGIGRTNFNTQEVYNPSLSASVKFYLGGREESGLTDVDRALLSQFRGGGFRLAVEPFYGQINFSEDLRLPENQALAGVSAGFDFGPYVGLRGFYWRALEQEKALDDFTTDFTDLTFYGGELDLRFANQFGGITPYLKVGGGYMNAGSDYESFSGFSPDDRYFAMGGGGIEVPLSAALKLQGSVRALLMSNEEVEDLNDPGNVFASYMYSAGLTFNLGGSGRTAGDVLARQQVAEREEAMQRTEQMELELAQLRAQVDSMETARMRQMIAQQPRVRQQPVVVTEPVMMQDSTGAWKPVMVQDSTGAWQPLMREQPMAVEEPMSQPQSNISRETITVPVPETGEIYIRFGKPDSTASRFEASSLQERRVALADSSAMQRAMEPGLSAEEMRAIMRDVIREQMEETGTDNVVEMDIEQRLRDLEDRMDERMEREMDRLRADMRARDAMRRDDDPDVIYLDREGNQVDAPVVTYRTEGEGTEMDSVEVVVRRGLVNAFQDRERAGVLPFTGVRVGRGPEQFLIGTRLDYRFPGRSVRFMPEVVIGFGDGTSLNLIANAVQPLRFTLGVDAAQPYVGGGLGFVSNDGLSGLNLVLNLLGGVEYTLGNGFTVFGEYNTQDFFDFNRIFVGARLRF